MAFDVAVPDVEELGEGDPVEVAAENARRKAEAVTARGPDGREQAALASSAGAAVLGVDTLVVLDEAIFGKPRDEDHARAMLAALSGREHRVVSGLAISRSGRMRVTTSTTLVRFRKLASLLDWYVATGEWRGRAGGYAIQGRGAALVTGIQGDYLNVVGLPVSALLDLWPGVLDAAR